MCNFVFKLGWSTLTLGCETFGGNFDHLVEGISENIGLTNSYPECFSTAWLIWLPVIVKKYDTNVCRNALKEER